SGDHRDLHSFPTRRSSDLYMEEAERFDWLVAMNDGQILATGTPQELLQRTGTPNLDAAFIALLPEELRKGHHDIEIPKREFGGRSEEHTSELQSRENLVCR